MVNYKQSQKLKKVNKRFYILIDGIWKRRDTYNQNKKCPFCKILITNQAERCKSCDSKQKKGKHLSPTTEFKKGYVSPKKGKTVEEIYGKEKGKKLRQINSLTQTGKKLSKKTKEKISKAGKGRKAWNKGLTKETDERIKKQGEKVSKNLKGKFCKEKSSNWKGGITPINKKLRNSPKFRKWRKEIFKRDNWTCQECHQKGGHLHPHHLKPLSKYPKLVFDINNGITLCVACHRQTYFNEEDWTKYFQEKLKRARW